MSSKRLRSGATNSILPRISVAAVKCLSVVKPLLNYWYQLPQHSEAVVTIIDRAIRGFIASARDELENLNWKLQSSHKTALKNVLSGMSVDPFFAEYKRSVYGDNCTSVDELLGLRETSTGGTIVRILCYF